jgi:hypothetical protein
MPTQALEVRDLTRDLNAKYTDRRVGVVYDAEKAEYSAFYAGSYSHSWVDYFGIQNGRPERARGKFILALRPMPFEDFNPCVVLRYGFLHEKETRLGFENPKEQYFEFGLDSNGRAPIDIITDPKKFVRRASYVAKKLGMATKEFQKSLELAREALASPV